MNSLRRSTRFSQAFLCIFTLAVVIAPLFFDRAYWSFVLLSLAMLLATMWWAARRFASKQQALGRWNEAGPKHPTEVPPGFLNRTGPHLPPEDFLRPGRSSDWSETDKNN